MKDSTYFIVALILRYVVSTPLIVPDQCIGICKEAKLPHLDLENYEQIVCQRGCRFFNIINKLKFDMKINTTKKECLISCEESYLVKKENEICQTGCNEMGKIQENLVSNLLIETENSIVLASPEQEIEFDVLSDPSLKSQLEVGFNVEYKIPETHIITMPIEITEEVIQVKESGDWLDCASRNSGIPRWILLSAILAAVLIALWLSFSTDKRNNQEEEENIVDIDIPDDKLILETNETLMEKDQTDLDCVPILVVGKNHICQELPPKYSPENEKI
ncbi:unnamed protein product [Phaedon cochleariae]|uniref:Transmembrane protein 59-like n=1 Tax=Phaedon cochleariae TaxID=80249 RepID=A0A9P0DUW6_PHACE|nr:unnamed protein product [Phaedon cochleariae]